MRAGRAIAAVLDEVLGTARPSGRTHGDVWDAIRGIGSLHTRLVPGFVIETRLEPGARLVTFANSKRMREPIVSLADHARRLAWSTEGIGAPYYSAAVQVLTSDTTTRVVWIADFLPDDIRGIHRCRDGRRRPGDETPLDRLGGP